MTWNISVVLVTVRCMEWHVYHQKWFIEGDLSCSTHHHIHQQVFPGLKCRRRLFWPLCSRCFFLSCRVLKNILNVGKKIIWSVLHILGVAVGVGGVPSRQWSEPPDDHESEEFYKTSWANLPQQWEQCQVDNGLPDDHESATVLYWGKNHHFGEDMSERLAFAWSNGRY